MSLRRRVVDTLRTLVWAHTVLGSSAHRIRSYQRAADLFDRWDGDIAADRASGALAATPGVGRSTLALVDDLIAGAVPDALLDVQHQLPESLFELRAVRGLGPKRTRALYDALGITSLAELAYACHENRLVSLPGFGAKLQRTLAAEAERVQSQAHLHRRDQAMAAFRAVQQAHPAAVLVGDLARGAEVVDQVEVVLLVPAPMPDTDVPVVTHVGPDNALVRWWYTARADHRDAVVAHAARRGLKLGIDALMRKRSPVDVSTPDALYTALDLTPVPPAMWEGSTLLRDATAPRLIRRSDLRGALHNHTTASDGTATVEQMRDAAHARGLQWLHISDHSPSAHYAGGLDVERLFAQVEHIRSLPEHATALLTGVEADILADGRLDHPPAVLERLDVVVASIHDRMRQDGAAITERLCRAAEQAHVIGHPTGRLLLGRPPADVDMAALVAACARTGCALELNANPRRLDLSAQHAAMAREAGVLVSIAADAHSTNELDNLDHGIAVARRAGLRPDDVVNTRDLDGIVQWAASRNFG